MASLNQFLPFRNVLIRSRIFLWNHVWGMNIHPTSRISMSAKLDKTYPAGIHIGAYTTVTFKVAILSHDMCRALKTDTRIGENCFIGAHAIILPGVTIGDQCIVAAGSVVDREVPSNSIVAGNPAKVIRSGITTRRYGVLEEVFQKQT